MHMSLPVKIWPVKPLSIKKSLNFLSLRSILVHPARNVKQLIFPVEILNSFRTSFDIASVESLRQSSMSASVSSWSQEFKMTFFLKYRNKFFGYLRLVLILFFNFLWWAGKHSWNSLAESFPVWYPGSRGSSYVNIFRGHQTQRST